jgi:hypothetical protein
MFWRPSVELFRLVPSFAEELVNMSNEINSALGQKAVGVEPLLGHGWVHIVRGGGEGMRVLTQHLGQPPPPDGLTRSFGKDDRWVLRKVKALSQIVDKHKVRCEDPF